MKSKWIEIVSKAIKQIHTEIDLVGWAFAIFFGCCHFTPLLHTLLHIFLPQLLHELCFQFTHAHGARAHNTKWMFRSIYSWHGFKTMPIWNWIWKRSIWIVYSIWCELTRFSTNSNKNPKFICLSKIFITIQNKYATEKCADLIRFSMIKWTNFLRARRATS